MYSLVDHHDFLLLMRVFIFVFEYQPIYICVPHVSTGRQRLGYQEGNFKVSLRLGINRLLLTYYIGPSPLIYCCILHANLARFGRFITLALTSIKMFPKQRLSQQLRGHDGDRQCVCRISNVCLLHVSHRFNAIVQVSFVIRKLAVI